MTPDDVTLRMFVENWDLFQTPALAGAVAGALLGWLGVYVVLKRMVFLSASLSQAAGLGVAGAYYAQLYLGLTMLSPMGGALIATGATVVLLMRDRSHLASRRDSLLGMAYLLGAAGTLAIGTRITQEVQDIQTVVFGSAVAVAPEDFTMLVVTAAAILGVQVWWLRGFLNVAFDPDGARVRGLPLRLIDLTLLASLAVAVSVGARVLGALPVFAFSVLPAMAAVRIAANVRRALVLGAALGALAGFAGYVAAFRFQLPVGAAQALVAALLVVVAEAAGWVARRIGALRAAAVVGG